MDKHRRVIAAAQLVAWSLDNPSFRETFEFIKYEGGFSDDLRFAAQVHQVVKFGPSACEQGFARYTD